jgi:prefoldin subunit 5
MHISQADSINLLYKSYNDTINSLKKSAIKDKLTFYDTLIKKVYVQADSSLYWKAKLEAAKKIVVPPTQHDGDDKFIPMVLGVLALFLFLHK